MVGPRDNHPAAASFVPAPGTRWPSASVAHASWSSWPITSLYFIFFFLNQHALSDTFITVFNSRKSVFALEERIRT